MPWTDAFGDQLRYVKAVRMERAFHDNRDDGNCNRIKNKIRSVRLLRNLCGRGADLVADIYENILASDGAVSFETDRIYRRESLSVTAQVFQEQQALHVTCKKMYFPLDCLR